MLDLRKDEIEAAIQKQLNRSKQRRDGQGRPAVDQRDVQMCVFVCMLRCTRAYKTANLQSAAAQACSALSLWPFSAG